MKRYIMIAVMMIALSGCATMQHQFTEEDHIGEWVDSIFYALAECH
jgi:hypothetical protein